MSQLRQRMTEELRLRNSSESTMQAYLGSVQRFSEHFGTSPQRLNVEHVRQFLLHLRDERKLSWSAIHVYRAALRFLYVRVLKQTWFDQEIQRPKRHPRLPTVLSAGEITRILEATRNLLHWTILATLYATGLRCNELLHLKVGDIASECMVVHVREGKGQVPRDIALSPALLERLRVYWRWRKPKNWLFPSRHTPHGPHDG
jgi:integrase/recombinase XerD